MVVSVKTPARLENFEELSGKDRLPEVYIETAFAGNDGRMLKKAKESGYQGIVIEGAGRRTLQFRDGCGNRRTWQGLSGDYVIQNWNWRSSEYHHVRRRYPGIILCHAICTMMKYHKGERKDTYG